MKWKMAIVKTQELWYSVFNGLETLPETIPASKAELWFPVCVGAGKQNVFGRPMMKGEWKL